MPENETATTEPQAEDTATVSDEKPLGESGEKALKAERDRANAAEREKKALAKKLQDIEDAGRTEAERAEKEVERARAELAELTAEKNRAVVAADKSIPQELLAGPASTSPENLAAFADALIQFRGETDRLHVPGEGKSPDKSTTTDAKFVKDLFSGD